jgi:hypothetical protein
MHQPVIVDPTPDREFDENTRVYREGRLIPVTLSFYSDIDQSVIDSLRGKLIDQMEKDLIYGN